jgi:hypothetical protein
MPIRNAMKGMKMNGISSTVHGRLPTMANWKISITATEMTV